MGGGEYERREGLEFGIFRRFWFDPRWRLYRLDAQDQLIEPELPVPRKTLEVLKYLLERPGKRVTTRDLQNGVWEGAERNPGVHISHLREVVEGKEARRNQEFGVIITVPSKGDTPLAYQLDGPVKRVERLAPDNPGRLSAIIQVSPERLQELIKSAVSNVIGPAMDRLTALGPQDPMTRDLVERTDCIEQTVTNETAEFSKLYLRTKRLWEPEALSLARQQRIVIELKGKVLFTNLFLMNVAKLCRRKPFLSRCLSCEPKFLNGMENLKTALIMHFIFNTLNQNQRVERKPLALESITLMGNEILNRLLWILLGKSYELGLIAKRDSYAISREANENLGDLLYPMLAYNMSTEDIRFGLYEAWRNIVATVGEDLTVEDKPFINILPLFMYSVHYDHGLVAALEKLLRSRHAMVSLPGPVNPLSG
jgi:DNA-binding winged helix-turn-helix (wHTH) protein